VPGRADTQTVCELIAAGAQLLEVLPESAFRREHLPGAHNIPLGDLTQGALDASGLDPHRTTVVYCYDHECDLSSRGAALLEALGFSDVYDYPASKTAWLGEGLPVEGTVPAASRAGAIARPLPTCTLDETVRDVKHRFGPDHVCAVVDGEGIVLGIARSDVALLADDTPVRAVMQPGPPSVRPSVTASKLAESMERDGRSYVLVNTSLGRLIGIITPSDLHGHH
jgi:rhodanese-related sulfurtransferase/CBS domain-containing protein